VHGRGWSFLFGSVQVIEKVGESKEFVTHARPEPWQRLNKID
jgi:hypothetical protein